MKEYEGHHSPFGDGSQPPNLEKGVFISTMCYTAIHLPLHNHKINYVAPTSGMISLFHSLQEYLTEFILCTACYSHLVQTVWSELWISPARTIASGRLKWVSVAMLPSYFHHSLGKCIPPKNHQIDLMGKQMTQLKMKPKRGEKWGWASGDGGGFSTRSSKRFLILFTTQTFLAVRIGSRWSMKFLFNSKQFIIVNSSLHVEKSSEQMFQGW